MLADGGVDTFLQEVFEFKSRPDFLGIVTNLHSKCAYAHGTIHSRQINAIADLHDYLVDAAKNGYVFGEEAYEAFQATAVGFHGKSEAKPAYRRAIAAARTRRKNRDGTGSEPAAETEEAIKYKRHDISDHVYFEVIDPHVEATVREFERSCSAAVTEDGDIGRYLLRQLALVGDDDAALAHALAELRRAVAAVKQRWCGRQAGRSGSDSAEYDAIRALCADMYRAIQPCEGVRQHPVARRWAAASPLPGVPSEWSLLKAAVLCDAHHDKHYFVFAMAGRELAFLKATCRAGAHILVAPMWATLKPRRAAKAREAAAA